MAFNGLPIVIWWFDCCQLDSLWRLRCSRYYNSLVSHFDLHQLGIMKYFPPSLISSVLQHAHLKLFMLLKKQY